MGAKLTTPCSAEPIPPSFEPSKATGGAVSSRLESIGIIQNTSNRKFISTSSWNVRKHLLIWWNIWIWFQVTHDSWHLIKWCLLISVQELFYRVAASLNDLGFKLEGFFATAASPTRGNAKREPGAGNSGHGMSSPSILEGHPHPNHPKKISWKTLWTNGWCGVKKHFFGNTHVDSGKEPFPLTFFFEMCWMRAVFFFKAFEIIFFCQTSSFEVKRNTLRVGWLYG